MNRHGAGTGLDASTDSLSRASPDYVRHQTGWAARWVPTLAVVAVLGTGVPALAADSDNAFQSYTDEELSEVAADWQSLTSEERRDYFIEVRRRMAEAGKKPPDPERLPQIVGERRFGRIIPQPDGSVLHIEGVVRYRGSGKGGEDREGGSENGVGVKDVSQTETPPDYGTGFEQRVEQAGVAEDSQEQRPVTVPVVAVATDNGVRQTEEVTEIVTEIATEEDNPETATSEHGAKDGGRAQGRE